MTGPQKIPDEWPVDREVEYLENKLGPFESHRDWQQKHTEERKERLGEDGHQLVSSLGLIKNLLQNYDMTPDEAISCIQYEINKYNNGK